MASQASAAFLPDALDANRSGRLTDAQRDGLQQGLARKHSGLTGIVSRAVDPLAKDVASGEVSSIEGAITKSSESKEFGGNEGGTKFRITVAGREVGRQEFRSGRELWEFAPATGMVRLFFLPRRRWAINLELLPVGPAGAVSNEDFKGLAADYTATRKAGDKVGEAEASARLTSAWQESTGAPPTDEPADDPEPLTSALIGNWTSPLFSIRFEDGATFTARLPDGSEHQGRFSLEEDGRLRVELPGAPMVADAKIEGGALVLSMDGQTVAFRREDAR